jgi:hypothetical protein
LQWHAHWVLRQTGCARYLHLNAIATKLPLEKLTHQMLKVFPRNRRQIFFGSGFCAGAALQNPLDASGTLDDTPTVIEDGDDGVCVGGLRSLAAVAR